ncbi:MAG TPA: hypothetical protein VK589_06275 [Chryseolinea sp.]|nr:hypothetical protein [Chryseolinea sp.]
MEADAERQDSLVDAAGDLIETYRDLLTVRIVEHTSMGASISIVGIISLVIIVFVLLFAGFGAAWWIGDTMNNMKAGFFIVGGFYTLVLIIVLATAKSFLIPSLRNMIIKNIYEQD